VRTHPRRHHLRSLTSPLGAHAGFTLLELMLGLTVLTTLSGAIYVALRPTAQARDVATTAARMEDLGLKASNAFGVVGTFEGVTSSRLLAEQLYTSSLQQLGPSGFRTSFGTPLVVEAPTPTELHVRAENVPGGACPLLAGRLSGADDVWVGTTSVHSDAGVDVSDATLLCGAGAPVTAIWRLAPSIATADSLLLAPGNPSTLIPSTPQVPLVAGVPSSVDPAPPASVLAPTSVGPGSPGGFTGGLPGNTTPSAVTTPSSPLTPSVPSITPSFPPACSAPAATAETATGACPFGSDSLTLRRVTTYSCPNAWQPAQASTGSWVAWSGACSESRTVACPAGFSGSITEQRTDTLAAGTWTLGTWATVSNTCTATPTCTPTSESVTNTQWVPTSDRFDACPPGFVGDRRTPQEAEQSQVGNRAYTCPSGTWTPWSYGAWSPTGAVRDSGATVDSCTVGCTPNSDSVSESRWVLHSGRTENCASGEFGSRTFEQERQESRSGSRSFTCPAASWTPWSYSPWSDTGSRRDTGNVSGACTPCPSPSTELATQWTPRSAACPSGQSGTHTWEAEQSQSRAVSYACPSGTTSLPSPTTGAWSGWTDTGSTRNVVNTCAPTPPSGSWQEVCYGAIFNAGGGNYACSHLTGGNYGAFTGSGTEGLYPVTYLAGPYPACGPSTVGRYRFVYAGQWGGGNGAPGGFGYGSFEVCTP
jgi:prepilin-type N-terminal cleavage/methylation domain-containing protein